MSTKVQSQQGSVPVAKLLAVESQVGKLTSEMEKLILISTQHGTRIKELIVASSNSVSQVEMMSTVTTSRFQHMNDLKALKSSLQTKYEKSGSGIHGEHAHDEADSKDAKNFTSKLFEVQNEVANQNFKANMEMNKLKMELKASKKEYDDLKRFVEVMETKLTVFIQDAKDSGINTTIEMSDMPEMGRTAVKRRASILSMDGVTVGFGGGQALHSPSGKYSGPDAGQPGGAFPGHFSGTFPGLFPGQYPPGQFPIFPPFPMFPPQGYPGAPPSYSHPHTPFSPNRMNNNEAIPEHNEDFPLPTVSGSAYHPYNAAPGGLDASQLQQMQILHQQQLYYQQHMQAQQQHGAAQPAPPMTDSGMSTPGAHSGQRLSIVGDNQGSPSGPTSSASVGTPADSSWQAAAHRVLHPQHQYHQQTYPGMQPSQYPYPCNPFAAYAPYGGMFSSTQPVDPSQDPEAAAIASLAAPILTKEERYYRNQYKAMKELILATMDCKDISLFEPDGSHEKTATASHHFGTSQNQALDMADAKDKTHAVDNTVSNSTAGTHYGHGTEDPEIARLEAEDRLKKRVNMHLRHQNRDLFRNMRKVKEIEGVALNYADFCVNNAVNMIDGAAYDKFKDILMCSELSRFHEKALTQSTVEVQTDEFSSGTSGELGRRRTSSFGRSPSNRRRSTKPRALEFALGGFPGAAGSPSNAGGRVGSAADGSVGRARTRSRVDSFGSQHSDSDGSRGHSAGGSNPADSHSAGLPALEPPKPMLLTLQELREAQEDESDAEDIADIIEMELASSAAPLDFGDAILPAQFSSKGRKATICEFSGQVLRDPALDFLDTSFGDVEAAEGALVSDVTPNSPAPVLRSASFKQSSFKSNLDTAYYGVDAAPTNTSRPTTAGLNTAELATLKAQMTAVMDKKLLKLYQGLDERWKGLDQTNTGILHKLKKFQDIIVNMNDDSQRLLMSNQVLAGLIAKQDNRLFDALEPMYIALETHKESTERLERLMMELSRTLQQQQAAASMGKTIERHAWREGDPVPDLKTVMAAMKPVQMPIDMILRNSHNQHPSAHANHAHLIPQVNAATGNAMHGTAHPDAINSDGQGGAVDSAQYNVLELTETRPAKQMSEHELDEVLRQLRQYAGMYETMMQNYQVIINRLKEEDVRKSGNFALKKPHLTGTRPMQTVPHATHRPTNNQQNDAISSAAAAASTLVPHPPGRMVVHVPKQSSADNLDTGSFTDDVILTTDTAATADYGDTEVGFASPQRVRSQSGEPTSPIPQHYNNHHSTTGKPFPFSKKDILALLERSDLSSNVEIVRIKNELARLKNSLSNRRTPSPSRNRGQAPTTTFPSLFTSLGAADFAVLRHQAASPTGGALRTKGPPAGAGFQPGSARNAIPVQAVSALPALSVRNTPGTERRPRLVMQDSLGEDELLSLSADLPPDYVIPTHDTAAADPQAEQYTSQVSVSPVAVEPQDDYIVGGVLDDENGLDEKSLSAYEYLTHPHTSHSHSLMLGEAEALDGTPTKVATGTGPGTGSGTGTGTANVSHSHTPQRVTSFTVHPPLGPGEKVVEAGVPFVKVRAPVEIVYATETPTATAAAGVSAVNSAPTTANAAQATAATLSSAGANVSSSTSGASKWGSAASIRSSANTNPKVVSSLAATSSPARPVAHNPLLSPYGAAVPAAASAATGNAVTAAAKSAGAQAKAARKTLAPAAATSIAQARLENQSREAEKPDPVRSVDILLRAEGIVNGDIAPFSATGSVRTGGIPVPTPPVKARPITNTATPRKVAIEKGAEKRDIRTAERDAKVWQKDYGSIESSGIMLQSGEFVSEKGGSVLAWDGQGAALLEGQVFVRSVVDMQGSSVDSLPLNLSRNLGENAFD